MAGVERAEIVVVGGGLLGLAATRSLHRRGHDVVLLERSTVGNPRGGSHGPSRIFRLGYPDPLYVEMAMVAGELWRELEAETGAELLRVTGQVSFGADLDALFDAMVRAGAPAQRMPEREARAAFPDIALDGDAVFEPASGVLAADRCLDALRAAATGAVREHVAVARVLDDESHVTVETDGTTWRADVAVVCPGPWSSALLSLPTFATLEHVAYVRRGDGPQPELPVFIAHGRPAAYGLPTPAFDAYKIALHHAGISTHADDERDVDVRAVAAIADATRRWLPGFDPEAVRVETCIYDNTPDEDFVLDRRGRVVVGAGTSGHGFKFGPLLGELLADLATGAPPRVALDRFALDRAALRG
jgi:sarcosine oxidase